MDGRRNGNSPDLPDPIAYYCWLIDQLWKRNAYPDSLRVWPRIVDICEELNESTKYRTYLDSSVSGCVCGAPGTGIGHLSNYCRECADSSRHWKRTLSQYYLSNVHESWLDYGIYHANRIELERQWQTLLNS